METVSLRELLNDAVAVATATVAQVEACEALLARGEEERTERSENRPIEVIEAKVVEGKIVARMQGVAKVYHTRITPETATTKRSYHCSCPDSRRRGREVGPCKHTLALARHWRDHIQSDVERIEHVLVGFLF